MNKTVLRVLAAVAVLVVAVVLVLVFQAKDSGQMRFALVPKSVGHPYWEGVREGMEEAAGRLNVAHTFHGPPEASIEEQIKIVEGFIAQGYNGIGISPNDPNAVKDVIKRAMDRGIAVVTFDSDSPDSNRLMYIGTDNREAGRVGGREMIRLLGAKPGGSDQLLVQLIGGTPGAWNLNQRMDGFREAVKGTHIKLADVLFNEENPDTALRIAENAINAHSDLRGIFCCNGIAGPGAALAVKGAIERGRIKPGQIHVVAFDTTEDILNFVDEGIIDCTLAQQTRKMGALSLENLVKFARQRKQNGRFDVPPRGSDIIDTGVSVVLPKDVKSYRTKPAPKK